MPSSWPTPEQADQQHRARHRRAEHRRAGRRAHGRAYDTKDQEDEHSCFSDNTNADILGDQDRHPEVYLGELPGTTGPTVSPLEAVDPELDAKLRDQLDTILADIEAFPAPSKS